MSIIFMPYHLDEYLPDLELPVKPDTTVLVSLPDTDVWGRLAHLYDTAAEHVARSVPDVPVVASGDCTTALATMAGLSRAGVDAAIVWFDAHGDVQTVETSASGYIGGMVLRLLAGYRPELITGRLGVPAVAADRIVLVDARDLDPPEVDYLARTPIRRATVDGLSAASLPAGPLLLHLDLDVLDAAELPGLLFPVPDGPAVPALLAAVARVMATGRVVAVDLACTWRPGDDDPNGARARLLEALLDIVRPSGQRLPG